MDFVVNLALFGLLVGLTFFFNLAELALIAVRPPVSSEGTSDRTMERIRALKQRPGLFLAAIRAGDLLTDMAMGAFVATWLSGQLEDVFRRVPILDSPAPWIASITAFTAISYVVLVFADLVPKSLALGAPMKASAAVAGPLSLIIRLTRPFLSLLEGSSAFLLKVVGAKTPGNDAVTKEEIRRILAEGLSAGYLREDAGSIMQRVLDMNLRQVRTIMTPRRDIEFVSVKSASQNLRQSLLQARSSRVVVISENDDEPVLGTIARSDVFAKMLLGEDIDLTKLASAPRFVAENESVLSLVNGLKSEWVHVFFVLDEFGSLTGLVTSADILEAFFGEIAAPGETNSDREMVPQEDGSYLVDGRQPVDDLIEALGLNFPMNRPYKTVAGLIISTLGHLPSNGESVEAAGWRFEVGNIEMGTIKLVKITRIPVSRR